MSEKGKEREGRHRDHLQINYGRPVAGLIGCDGEREREREVCRVSPPPRP